MMSVLDWIGAPIVDACAVRADFGHLLVLTADGALHGVDVDARSIVRLCSVELPELAPAGTNSFGAAAHRLHASSDGRHAAIVVDKARHGMVVETRSGAVTMRLDGGDYLENTVPFSACFLRFEGRDVFVHRVAWNRLDVADPATGESLTQRDIASYETAGEPPEHYLDYFHGQLRPSPEGGLLFDDGWVWHPLSIPRVWSVTRWLNANPWESEDGPSIVDLAAAEDWTKPACWISERRLALWGLADWDAYEAEEAGQGPGVRIVDVTAAEPSANELWPMESQAEKVLDLFSDGVRLFVATETGTTVWDIATRAQMTALPGFTTRLLDRARNTLVAFGLGTIREFPISRPVAAGGRL